MNLGVNRAEPLIKSAFSFNEAISRSKPCVFLSHRSLDKEMVKKIGEYIKYSGIDIYLDENDENLQVADATHNDKMTVDCIKKGIIESTHILCILSKSTVTSWWVPYEIGFGDNNYKDIASLKIAELSEREIPSFLKINLCLKGIDDLNAYINNICLKNNLYLQKNSRYSSQSSVFARIEESSSYHPLAQYL
jgi:hypothetical protein